MSDAALRRLAYLLLVVAVGVDLCGVALHQGLEGLPLLRNSNTADISDVLFVTATCSAGTLVAFHRPRHGVAWLLLLGGLVEALCAFGQAYGARALGLPGSGLPAGDWVMALTAPLWVVAVFMLSVLLMLRYPSGRVTGEWARRVERATWIALAVTWFGYAHGDGAVSDEVIGGHSPLPGPSWLSAPALPALLVLLAALVFSVVHTVVRTVRAQAPERQQLALLVTVAPVAVVLLLLPWSSLQYGMQLIPFAVALGVLRYRLLGIDVIVRRTLLYGALTALVVLDFAVVTWVVRRLVGSDRGADLVAALLVTAVLGPARTAVQRVVDRFVYGDRQDPLRAFDRLAREAASTDALTDVLAAVAQGLRLPAAELHGADGLVASWGEVATSSVVPLVVAGERVGELRVAPRRGEPELPAADQRLLEALAPLLGLVVRSTRLAQELAAERQRVLDATAAERSRLRRDLHDGLGPSLTGIGLGLEAAQSADPERSEAILARLREEASASLVEVRRIIDDLRPSALDAQDLLGLVRQKAAHLTSTTPVRVVVDAPGALGPLAPHVEAAALRIVDEALTNVVRHARATSCTVRLVAEDGLRVEVTDNGVGYRGPRDGGVGVPSMRSRAQAVGGTLELVSPGSGTVLTARLPA
jgi:signal transduction histidine kinase